MDNTVPIGLRPLVERYGEPVDVEDARARWSALVTAAEAGAITLITRDRYQWAALVPINEVAEISPDLPTWPVSDARAKLGHLVGKVHNLDTRVQVLTRHRRPVAALIDPGALVDRPEPADRLPAETLLRDGYRIELVFEPGQPGRLDPDGAVLDEPEDWFYAANAYDNRDNVIAVGVGDTLGEALLRLAAPPPVEPADNPPF
ncbi:type II toxin-antitoxin system Phd/YefM family antitoxin [Micromonospora sp. NPDC048170]|uniref:type II toxin-antitoxin system Phd/YefM family antitoxin n=1 Tax=Micromonospora sp. NPDC048170 TaxID=3154819 RepID=UPI0033F01F96